MTSLGGCRKFDICSALDLLLFLIEEGNYRRFRATAGELTRFSCIFAVFLYWFTRGISALPGAFRTTSTNRFLFVALFNKFT